MLTLWTVGAVMCAAMLLFILPPMLKDKPVGKQWLIPVLVAGLPAVVLLAYMMSGNRLSAEEPVPAADLDVPTSPAQKQALPSVADMLPRLEQRLENEPDDAKGWQLLGRTYDHLGRKADAEHAYARAQALGFSRVGMRDVPATVRGRVTLAPELMTEVRSTDSLFVFARSTSSRMPVAVIRKTVADLPLDFTLDDSMAMSPEMRLSSFDKVIVGARISRSGNAIAGPGDLEGYSSLVSTSADENVPIIINQSRISQPAGGVQESNGG